MLLQVSENFYFAFDFVLVCTDVILFTLIKFYNRVIE